MYQANMKLLLRTPIPTTIRLHDLQSTTQVEYKSSSWPVNLPTDGLPLCLPEGKEQPRRTKQYQQKQIQQQRNHQHQQRKMQHTTINMKNRRTRESAKHQS
jgi:hypothetical protein